MTHTLGAHPLRSPRVQPRLALPRRALAGRRARPPATRVVERLRLAGGGRDRAAAGHRALHRRLREARLARRGRRHRDRAGRSRYGSLRCGRDGAEADGRVRTTGEDRVKSSFKVRPCRDLAEFSDAVFAIGQYFGMEPTEERMERFSKNLPIERMHAALENGTIVGGAGAFPFELTVPGAVVPTAGVTVVGTFPTHRRRGVLRAMMRAQLDDVHERGEPLALLWASEDTIYGRFGYGMASQCTEVSIPTAALGVRAAVRARGDAPDRRRRGGAEALPARLGRRPAQDARDARAQPQLVGVPHPVRAARQRRARTGRSGSSCSRRTGGPRGTRSTGTSRSGTRASPTPSSRSSRRSRSTGGRRPRSGATSSTSTGRRGRPRACCRSTTRSGGCSRRRATCGRASATGSGCGSSTSARRSPRGEYAADGAVVFDVIDEFCPWNAGTLASVGRAREADDRRRRSSGSTSARSVARISARFTFSGLVRGGRVEELRRGAAARADAMFAAERAPWCPEIF